MVYYSKLPYMAVGPVKFGAQQAHNVGLCEAPGVHLTDDGRCVPTGDAGTTSGGTHQARAAACTLMGATLHSDGQRCAVTPEQICASIPGTTFADGTCDHQSVMGCHLVMALNDDPQKSIRLLEGGRCATAVADPQDCPIPLVDGLCITEPIRAPARDLCASDHTWEDGRCIVAIPEMCPSMMTADPQTGVCRMDWDKFSESITELRAASMKDLAEKNITLPRPPAPSQPLSSGFSEHVG